MTAPTCRECGDQLPRNATYKLCLACWAEEEIEKAWADGYADGYAAGLAAPRPSPLAPANALPVEKVAS